MKAERAPWAESTGMILQNKSILFEDRAQMHALRHLSLVSDATRQKLLDKSISNEEIEKELAISGSKFFAEFATCPDDIMAKILENTGQLEWQDHRCEVRSFFSKDAYPGGIGYANVIPLDDLTQDETATLIIRPRDKENPYPLNFAKSERQILTWQANLILVKKDELVKVVTVFPGEFSPPIPDKSKQCEEEYNRYDVFWKQHVFMEKTQ